MHTTKIILALAAGLLAAAGARADDSGSYLGASLGEATQRGDGFDGSDTTFRWLGGWSFSRYFAAEAGFADAGKQKDTVGAFDVTSSSDGTFAAFLAKLPIGKVAAPYAKMGYVFYDTTTTVSSGAARALESTSDDDLLYGGGLEFHLGENVRLRADYEEVDVPDVTFDIYSVVFTYQF